MLDLDAAVDLDTPLYDLDGNPVGPVQTVHGGGHPIHFKPFVPRKERIVGYATATLGPLEAHAAAVRTDIRALEDQLFILGLLL
jgi:hypothetical protein